MGRLVREHACTGTPFWAVLCALSVVFVTLLHSPVYAASRDPLAQKLPAMAVMKGARSQWVGKQMAINGLPVSIRLFWHAGSVDEVEQFYLKWFKSLGNGKLAKRNVAHHQVLSYELRGYAYSVQYRQNGGKVDGKLMVSPVPSSVRLNRKSTFPLPRRCSTISKVQSLDFGKRSETLTLMCDKSIDNLEDGFLSDMEREGWALVAQKPSRSAGVVLDFQKAGELLQITISQMGTRALRRSQVLIHWVVPDSSS